MSRDEIEQHIRTNMHTDTDGGEEIGVPLCQQCGTVVDESVEHVVHKVPEHGGEMTETLFCSGSCFVSFLNDLMDV